MSKQIMIAEDVVKELERIRKDSHNNCSYSEAIRKLLVRQPNESWLLELNKHFTELEESFPDMEMSFEIMRIIAIRFLKLPVESKGEHIKELNEQLEDVMKFVSKIEESKNAVEESIPKVSRGDVDTSKINDCDDDDCNCDFEAYEHIELLDEPFYGFCSECGLEKQVDFYAQQGEEEFFLCYEHGIRVKEWLEERGGDAK